MIPPDPKLSFVCETRRELMLQANYVISCCNEDMCNNNSTDDRDYAKFLLPSKHSDKSSGIGKANNFQNTLGLVNSSSSSITVIVKTNIHLGTHHKKKFHIFILGSSKKSSFRHLWSSYQQLRAIKTKFTVRWVSSDFLSLSIENETAASLRIWKQKFALRINKQDDRHDCIVSKLFWK